MTSAQFSHFEVLLRYLYEQQFVFVNFPEVCKHSDTSSRGSRQVALRYDVHVRDLKNAYEMLALERDVLGSMQSTSFVMFGLQGSTMLESLTELVNTGGYDQYIDYCFQNGATAEPHISPLNDYLRRFQPEWKDWDESAVAKVIVENYACEVDDSSIRLSVVKDDVLNLAHLNNELLNFIEEYVFIWTARYGVEPKGFAVHGNQLGINRLLHNGVLMGQALIRERFPSLFEVHSPFIRKRLGLYSDCTLPYWMWDSPKFTETHLQLLVHPAQWHDQSIQRAQQEASTTQIDSGHLKFPYATPLDSIVNPVDFINSKLSRYEYSLQTKSCFYQ